MATSVPGKAPRRFTEQEKADILQGRRLGFTYTQLAERFHCTRQSIYNLEEADEKRQAVSNSSGECIDFIGDAIAKSRGSSVSTFLGNVSGGRVDRKTGDVSIDGLMLQSLLQLISNKDWAGVRRWVARLGVPEPLSREEIAEGMKEHVTAVLKIVVAFVDEDLHDECISVIEDYIQRGIYPPTWPRSQLDSHGFPKPGPPRTRGQRMAAEWEVQKVKDLENMKGRENWGKPPATVEEMGNGCCQAGNELKSDVITNDDKLTDKENEDMDSKYTTEEERKKHKPTGPEDDLSTEEGKGERPA